MCNDNNLTLLEIGEKLEALRLNEQLSQDEVCKQAGISRKTLSTLENGGNFTISTLLKLLKVYVKQNQFSKILSLPKGFDIRLFDAEIKKSKKKRAKRNRPKL